MTIEREQARDLLDDFLYFAQRAHDIVLRHGLDVVEGFTEESRAVEYSEQHQLVERFLDQEVAVEMPNSKPKGAPK